MQRRTTKPPADAAAVPTLKLVKLVAASATTASSPRFKPVDTARLPASSYVFCLPFGQSSATNSRVVLGVVPRGAATSGVKRVPVVLVVLVVVPVVVLLVVLVVVLVLVVVVVEEVADVEVVVVVEVVTVAVAVVVVVVEEVAVVVVAVVV